MQNMSTTYQIKTLTPIWTGGVETGKMDRIHETGILGSLRWWFEVLVRGLGGYACDPSNHSCNYDAEKPNNGLCDVCQVFGATGWKRRFRLIIQDVQMHEKAVSHPMKAERQYQDRRGNNRIPTWHFKNPAQAGQFSLQIQSLQPDFPIKLVQELIQLVTDWAALGARSQMGFGITELTSERLHANPFATLRLTDADIAKNLPSLQNMFFAQIKTENVKDEETFNLKYDLRRLFANDKEVRHFVMGTVQKERNAAKIFMSRPYNDGLIRIWGWIPEQANVWNQAWNRQTVLNQIKKHLSEHYSLNTWREFNALRDTEKQYTDIQPFLNSLWKGVK